ncbi:1,25-dihydroxyvitamin D(3) 24-hydroxylase, mitochondrial [Trichoplax sp. H2]|nr:1,25-dihydroxyvitamin D(3) 24-hydroxylase, mitochondrial [Trichoplax sp. H2]|eukprot:RDD37953.1 1,25-dihydroxyvitamin D(3) 24-hydroxylase, mitochondrial [Trichoplax sp. H2]
MMEMTSPLFMLPPYYKYLKTKYWKRFCSQWDTMFEIGMEIIRERQEELKSLPALKEDDKVDFLTDIIQRSNLSDERLNTTLIELMLGASDTTANTITWTLILLSKYPGKQKKLHKEIKSILKDGEDPDSETVHNAPYLSACIKEAMRLYPVIFNLIRQAKEDVVILGYQVPANLSQKFVIGCNNLDHTGMITRATLTPDKAVKITLTERP